MTSASVEGLNPHAPRPSRWRRVLGPLYVSGVFWYRLHLFGVRLLPGVLLVPAMFVFTCVFSVLLRRIRGAIASNLEPVLGPCSWLERQRRIFRTLHAFAWCLSERYELLGRVRPCSARLDGGAAWDELVASGRGFVLATAHVGGWEFGSMLAAGKQPMRVHLVREPEMDKKAQAFLERQLAELAAHGAGGSRYVTHFAADDATLGIELLQALRSGEVVAVQSDRPRAGAQTVSARLFGREACLPPGPAALARAAGVPLVPVFTLREGRSRYRVVVRPSITVARGGDRQKDVADAVQELASEIESVVRAHPYQWFCFARFWR